MMLNFPSTTTVQQAAMQESKNNSHSGTDEMVAATNSLLSTTPVPTLTLQHQNQFNTMQYKVLSLIENTFTHTPAQQR
jgi:hypothetical protein